jgi:hypothetical protein
MTRLDQIIVVGDEETKQMARDFVFDDEPTGDVGLIFTPLRLNSDDLVGSGALEAEVKSKLARSGEKAPV